MSLGKSVQTPPAGDFLSGSNLGSAMNYYPFHLGDYSAHTGHLDFLEDLAYRRLLDFYYLHESPLPLDVQKLAKLIRMPDEAACIRDVLNEFFYESEDGFRHTRCDQELEKMKDKQAKARASAQASVNARKANAQRTVNERSTNVKLPTPIPTPIPNIKKEPAVLPDWLDKDVWKAFMEMRSKIKKPLTETAVKLVWKKLEKMKDAGYSTTQILENSISNCWLDVYEPKRPANTAPNGLAGAI